MNNFLTTCLDEEEYKIFEEYKKNKNNLASYKQSLGPCYQQSPLLLHNSHEVFAGHPDPDDHGLIPEPTVEEYILMCKQFITTQANPRKKKTNKSNIWDCPTCRKKPVIYSYLNLYTHIKRHHTDKKFFKCPYLQCRVSSSKISGILYHICSQHANLKICCNQLLSEERYIDHKIYCTKKTTKERKFYHE